MIDRSTLRNLIYRWRRWLIAAALLVAARVALPSLLAYVIGSQASQALHAHVVVGDVDLGLLRGAVALKDVAVSSADPNDPTGPLIAWKLVAVNLRWLSLFHKTIQLEELIVDAPHVALERLQDGGFNLVALLPKADSSPPAADQAAPSTWAIAIDKIVLRTGGVRFNDRMISGSEPVEVTLPTIEVKNIALQPGVYGQPAHAHIAVQIDEGSLQIDADATTRTDGTAAETHLVATRLPLRRARVYIPKVGWSELGGTFSCDLVHRIDTNGSRHDVRGRLGLADVVVHVAGFEETALAWRSLNVQVDPIDLVARQALVTAVDIDGLVLPVRSTGDEPLPVLRAILAKSQTPAATAGAAPADSDPEADATAPQANVVANAPPAAVAAPDEPQWTWALNAVQLTDSKLEVLHGGGQLDVALNAEAQQLESRGDQPSPIKLALGIGESSLALDGKLQLKPLGFSGALTIDKLNLPQVITASNAIAPELLPAAQLDARLQLAAAALAQPAGDVEVSGTITVTNGQIALPAPQPALAVDELAIALERLHVAGVFATAANARSGDVDLRGKLALRGLRVTQTGAVPLALNAGTLAIDFDALRASGLLMPAGATGRGDIDWRGRIALSDLKLAQGSGPVVAVRAIDVGFDTLHGTGIAPPNAGPQQGDLRLRGTLSIIEPSVTPAGGGTSTASLKSLNFVIDDLTAPGVLSSALAAAEPAEIRLRGKLSLIEPRVAGTNAKEFALSAKALQIGIDDMALANPKSTKANPPRLRLSQLQITAPTAQLTRTADGIVMPQLGNPPAPAPGATPRPKAATATAAPAPVGGGTSAAAAGPSVDLILASFQLTDGKISFSDRAVKPAYNGNITLNADLKDVRFPELAANRIRVDATVSPQGSIKATGTIGPSGGNVDLKIDDLALLPFNSYAATYSPYGIGNGTLTVTTKASFASGSYDTKTSLRLHDLDVSGAAGDSLFQQNFGIPLTVALALLKDLSGNINLDIPVTADQKGMKVGIGTIVAGALRSALVGALASPLKLVGMAFQGDKAQAAAPPQIVFRAGRAELTPQSEEQIKQLAAFIASRPAMRVTLEAVPSRRDIVWLHEQTVAAELGKPQGWFGAVRNLGQGDKRDRIAAALAARARDEAGELDSEDSQTLEQWLAEKPQPTPEQLRALTESRLTKLETALRDEHGVDAARIARGEAATEPTDEAPAVRLRIGPANP